MICLRSGSQIAVLIAAALCVSQVSCSPSRKVEETKPNFVIFFADDVSYENYSYS